MKTTFLNLGAALLLSSSVATIGFAGTGHGDSGGHMGHMNDVKGKIKKALGDKYDKAVPKATKAQLATGKTIFTKSCSVCHGVKGKGNGPAAVALKPKPSDFTDATHSKFYSDQARLYIITKGIKGGAMTGWANRLKEDEIISVHAYIRSLRSAGGDDHNDGGKEHGH